MTPIEKHSDGEKASDLLVAWHHLWQWLFKHPWKAAFGGIFAIITAFLSVTMVLEGIPNWKTPETETNGWRIVGTLAVIVATGFFFLISAAKHEGRRLAQHRNQTLAAQVAILCDTTVQLRVLSGLTGKDDAVFRSVQGLYQLEELIGQKYSDHNVTVWALRPPEMIADKQADDLMWLNCQKGLKYKLHHLTTNLESETNLGKWLEGLMPAQRSLIAHGPAIGGAFIPDQWGVVLYFCKSSAKPEGAHSNYWVSVDGNRLGKDIWAIGFVIIPTGDASDKEARAICIRLVSGDAITWAIDVFATEKFKK